jgi:hypothetical protein
MKKFNLREQKKVLGRWNIDECDITKRKKIDWSNEDHCGPCGYSGLVDPTNNLDKKITVSKKS